MGAVQKATLATGTRLAIAAGTPAVALAHGCSGGAEGDREGSRRTYYGQLLWYVGEGS